MRGENGCKSVRSLGMCFIHAQLHEWSRNGPEEERWRHWRRLLDQLELFFFLFFFCKLDDFCFCRVHHHFSNAILQNAHKNRKMEIQLVKIICFKKWPCRSWKNGTWENTGFATRFLDWFIKNALHILSPRRQRRNNVLRTRKSLQKRGFIGGRENLEKHLPRVSVFSCVCPVWLFVSRIMQKSTEWICSKCGKVCLGIIQ